MANKQNSGSGSAFSPQPIRNYDKFSEYGRVGTKKYAGVLYEDFLPQLQGLKGIEAFKEMESNDDIVGAVMFAIKMLIRQVSWDVEPQGNTKADKDAAEFIHSCIKDISPDWNNTISEILSFLVYGWSYHEICYKRRMGKQKDRKLNSKYDDGLIGWEKIPIRAQDTLYRWEYDEDDELIGMSQMPPPEYMIRTIPLDKALHFVTESRKGSPEGRSILRNAYRSFYFKKRMQEIEGIGVERDLAGLPVVTAPEDTDIWDAQDADMVEMRLAAETLVQNVRRDALEGVVLPFGWSFQLLSGGSRRQFEIGSIIERYDSRIAMTTLADFVLLGHQQVGSFALSSDKTQLFAVALGTYLDIILSQFNEKAIPKLIDLNAEHFKGITEYPKLAHGDLEDVNLVELSTFIKDMTGTGVLTPDPQLEDFVRRSGKLPERVEGTEYPTYDDEDEKNHGDNKAQGGKHPQTNANTEKNDANDKRDQTQAAEGKRGTEQAGRA